MNEEMPDILTDSGLELCTAEKISAMTEIDKLSYAYRRWGVVRDNVKLDDFKRFAVEDCQKRILKMLEEAIEKERIAIISRPARKRSIEVDLDD